MSTKNTTDTTQSQQQSQQSQGIFNPQSMAAYQSLQPQIASLLGQYMTNPWQSGLFGLSQSQIGSQIGSQGSAEMKNALNNMTALGNVYSNPGAVLGSDIRQTALFNASDLASALISNLQAAQKLQQGAMTSSMGYSPLQVGSEGSGQSSGQSQSVTEQSGLGTWLTPLLGAVVGGLGSALTGGLTSALSIVPGAVGAAATNALPGPSQLAQQLSSPFGTAELLSGGRNFNVPGEGYTP